MATFKFVISDKEKSYQVEKEQGEAGIMIGKKIGDKVDAGFLIEGLEIQVTGGSDNDGFPMRPDIEGIGRRRIVATDGIGFSATHDGLRRRKTFVGNTISESVVQINCKVTKQGNKKLEEVFAKKDKKKDGDGKEEASSEEKPKKSETKQKKEE